MGLFKRLFLFFIIIFILGFIGYYFPFLTGKQIFLDSSGSPKNSVFEKVVVTKVVDGDTIHVNNQGKEEIIRFLGINTPEKGKPYYLEAKNFLRQELENKSIELLGDITDKDQYGRKLRYVFYENRFINVEILENGFATSFMLDNLKYNDKLIFAEKLAKTNEIGIWKKSSELCAGCIKLEELDPKVDFFIINNGCDFSCNLTTWFVKDDANHFFNLEELGPFESKEYSSIKIFKKEVWNDDHDRFFLRDNLGELVIFYEY